MKKILFMDLDNTLLDSNKKISEENYSAIRRALEGGNSIVICTGRPLCATTAQIEKLQLNKEGCYAICFNGGLVYDCYKKESIFKMSLNMDDVKTIFQKADEAGIHCQTYDSEDLLVKNEDPETEFYARTCQISYRVDPGIPDSLKEDPVKVLLIDLNDHGKLERFRNCLEAWARGRVSIFFSNDYYLEIVKEGISKGSAILWLCKYLNVPVENTVSAGDSENDIPMIETAGIGCAMANATPACKEAADYITEKDCDHSGLAEIIEKFMITA
ncbi:MAG TPA: Cof-type HAD-IIB family hydrolase [Lachnospiraceae bacterium]|nr:Cof-type HAD-IIB family hydrolase [Lachnospiraceae bacterium]